MERTLLSQTTCSIQSDTRSRSMYTDACRVDGHFIQQRPLYLGADGEASQLHAAVDRRALSQHCRRLCLPAREPVTSGQGHCRQCRRLLLLRRRPPVHRRSLDFAAWLETSWADNQDQLNDGLRQVFSSRQAGLSGDKRSCLASVGRALGLSPAARTSQPPWLLFVLFGAGVDEWNSAGALRMFTWWWPKWLEKGPAENGSSTTTPEALAATLRARFRAMLNTKVLDRHGRTAALPPVPTVADINKAMLGMSLLMILLSGPSLTKKHSTPS